MDKSKRANTAAQAHPQDRKHFAVSRHFTIMASGATNTLTFTSCREDEGGQGEEQGYPQTRGRCPGTEEWSSFRTDASDSMTVTNLTQTSSTIAA